MNVASLKLCKELYEISGWDSKTLDVYAGDGFPGDAAKPRRVDSLGWSEIPAYDLGYLLRKLPGYLPKYERTTYQGPWTLCMVKSGNEYQFTYETVRKNGYSDTMIHEYSDTPEDAAAKIAIELFKQSTLKPEDSPS